MLSVDESRSEVSNAIKDAATLQKLKRGLVNIARKKCGNPWIDISPSSIYE